MTFAASVLITEHLHEGPHDGDDMLILRVELSGETLPEVVDRIRSGLVLVPNASQYQ